ncbi:MAG: 4Fe-4S binding protein [Desulfitobacteriaceae bacterium]
MNLAETKVRVIEERCKGCGICVAHCPEKVLQFTGKYSPKGYEYVCLTNEEVCKSCAICAIVCPEIALHIYR